MATTVLLRRGPTETRRDFIPVEGELLLDTGEMRLYVGDGETPGGVLIKNGCGQVAEKILNGDLKYAQTNFGRGAIVLDDWEDII